MKYVLMVLSIFKLTVLIVLLVCDFIFFNRLVEISVFVILYEVRKIIYGIT